MLLSGLATIRHAAIINVFDNITDCWVQGREGYMVFAYRNLTSVGPLDFPYILQYGRLMYRTCCRQ